jgi:hypothetical protein
MLPDISATTTSQIKHVGSLEPLGSAFRLLPTFRDMQAHKSKNMTMLKVRFCVHSNVCQTIQTVALEH